MTRTFLLILILPLAACTSPGPGECPVDLEVIAPLMTDLHLAEGLTTEIPVLVKDSIQEIYFEKVLEDYQLSRAEFDSLMWIIRSEPAWVDSLYTRIGETLARLEAEL